ncbi:MAG: pseudouridine synthase [Gammaproteobacteria bacterium]
MNPPPKRPRKDPEPIAHTSLAPAAPRVQKALADAGVGSRREVESWIRSGRLTRNARPVALGERANPGDQFALDGVPLRIESLSSNRRILLYHKCAGELTTRHDPEERPTVFERLPRIRQGRWIAAGRLDFNSEGLLVFTTDGGLARVLMHPSSELPRVYMARISGRLTELALHTLAHGVKLEDGRAAFDAIEEGGGTGLNGWYSVRVHEGRNRLVRRLFESQGYPVNRLIRIQHGPFRLPRGLRRGQCHELDAAEIQEALADLGRDLIGADPDGVSRPDAD